ncbi:hypothetical protein SPBR_01983 [Sporothrix brasiliensis 5110]|uniref:Uncharacterized protein n=1 Tax=Sporothrix brasiliensis 5110 TaxID=1398154 RepID=A0A0C2EWR7_9PEZI|nr:uncharacterized protein SPBR_01983 [Sporothrix brasiliensis 5110]KIH91014.1 hypothetical protein SPBR_01983 [Sporothrix brasiliensis 5110]
MEKMSFQEEPTTTSHQLDDDDARALQARFHFTDAVTVFKELDRAAEAGKDRIDDLVVGNVTPANFRRVEAERDRLDRRVRLFYLSEKSTLFITIPTAPHETGHGYLYNLVEQAIWQMGANDQWRNYYATKFPISKGGGSSGEGDSAGGPRTKNSDRSTYWPTLVIEMGAQHTRERPHVPFQPCWSLRPDNGSRYHGLALNQFYKCRSLVV